MIVVEVSKQTAPSAVVSPPPPADCLPRSLRAIPPSALDYSGPLPRSLLRQKNGSLSVSGLPASASIVFLA
jgi:hypothetical protein